MYEDKTIYLDIFISPHRSLTSKGMRNLFVFIGALLFIIAFGFFLIGAWPIVGFAGIDVLLLYYAFKFNMLEAKRFEHIQLTNEGLRIRRVSPKGEEEYIKLEPNWLQISTVKRKGQTDAVRLRSHGKDTFIGSFLNKTARKKLVLDLKCALDDYKNNHT